MHIIGHFGASYSQVNLDDGEQRSPPSGKKDLKFAKDQAKKKLQSFKSYSMKQSAAGLTCLSLLF